MRTPAPAGKMATSWIPPSRAASLSTASPGSAPASGVSSPSELVDQGLTPLELAALTLLTRDRSESYELCVLRIAHSEGAAGSLARAVKLADLDDHLGEAPGTAGAPPYAWARRHIAFAQDRRGEKAPAAGTLQCAGAAG